MLLRSGKTAEQTAVKSDFAQLLNGSEGVAGVAANLPFEKSHQPAGSQNSQNDTGNGLLQGQEKQGNQCAQCRAAQFAAAQAVAKGFGFAVRARIVKS